MLAAVEGSEVMLENSLLVDEAGDNDELSEIWEEVAGRVTVTPLLGSTLSFDLEALASSFVSVFC